MRLSKIGGNRSGKTAYRPNILSKTMANRKLLEMTVENG
jgi:hypothetical protein